MQKTDVNSSQSIALDSKKLAEASTRDSSSMKAIAVLTMVFLPSTAVATIFSMGPFWSNEPGSIFSVSSDFWLYWAVTVPLTTIVMVVWQTWLWFNGKRLSRRLKDIEDEAGKGTFGQSSATTSNPTVNQPTAPQPGPETHRSTSLRSARSAHSHMEASLQPQAIQPLPDPIMQSSLHSKKSQ
ncbi:MAG: hypothetical protein L6R40_008530 [Gallowayella cf. fulva]|nr:MAG: hypothetical protein L6R40_008530 [Xanthomendoza cf. fulva]